MNALLFAADSLDRAQHIRRDPARLQSLQADPTSGVVLQWRGHMLADRGKAAVLSASDAAKARDLADEIVFLGLQDGRAMFAADISGIKAGPDDSPPAWEHGEWIDLRAAAAALPAADGVLLATGRALLNWHRSARFCGRCGAPTESREGGHARVCCDSSCATQHYPRTDCAVIMLVENDGRVLLHRQPAWPAGMWSILAGFVEPGETLEQAVRREVHEETGIIVDDVRYAGSQPWPFPSSLMIGFSARAVGGELRPDPHELEDASWFSRADIAARFSDAHRNENGAGPYLARPGSIARVMLDAWLSS